MSLGNPITISDFYMWVKVPFLITIKPQVYMPQIKIPWFPGSLSVVKSREEL